VGLKPHAPTGKAKWAEGAEGVEDGFDADDVALGLRHLGVVEEEPAIGGDGLGERQLGGQ